MLKLELKLLRRCGKRSFVFGGGLPMIGGAGEMLALDCGGCMLRGLFFFFSVFGS